MSHPSHDSKKETPGNIHMEVSEEIRRSPAEVFTFWRALENFPKFMGHVKEVRAVADNRYHWEVSAPLGTQMSWDADVTQVVSGKQIAWQSVAGSTVANSGQVTFEDNGRGGTRLHVRLSYTPPAGSLGHAVATLFGANPEQQMRDDLKRCKALLEGQPVEQGRGQVKESEVRANEDRTHRAH